MAKSFKFKNNNYVDSTGIVHNKTLLSTLLDKLLNVVPTKYLLATISDSSHVSNVDWTKMLLIKSEGNVKNTELTVENNVIKVGKNISRLKISASVFCEGIVNGAYIWGAICVNDSRACMTITSGTYYQSAIFPPKIINVQENDLISLQLNTSSSSNVSERLGVINTWLLVEIIE